MHIVIDGIIFKNNPYGGIARIFKNILPIMCNLDPNLQMTLFLRNNTYINLPEHNQISTILLGDVYKLRPWRLWKPHYQAIQNLILRILTKNSKGKIWLSTYFTRPPFDWHGKEVVWIHDMIHELFPDLLPKSSQVVITKKIALEVADKIFSNSYTTAKDVLQIYPHLEGKISIIPLSHDPIFTMQNKFHQKKHLTGPFILYVGKRSRYKGFDTLFSAYANWERKDNHRLAIVGETWSEQEEELIRQYELEDRIVLYEKIKDDLLCDLYNQAKALIYPSLYEGFGIPLLEAMACGCPVIASRIPSTLEVAGEIPIYFEPGNSESLKNALNYITRRKNVEERITLGMERASDFSWEKTAKTFYTHLKALNAK